MPPEGRLSPLHHIHEEAEAKLVPFGGWEMPLSYPSGTIAEHLACRNDAVVFDVSHLGTLRVSGPAAFGALQAAFTNDLNRIEPGRAQYTHLLNPVDGSVLDDIIVWWVDDERFDVMPNASNTSRVAAALEEIEPQPQSRDVTATRAVLALQGPNARERLRSVAPAAGEVGRFRVVQTQILDVDVVVAGTGYTGEDGVEIAVPAEWAAQIWDALIATGVTPAGLGARDTLRLEAGLPLHGQELGPGITPAQAGLNWVVRFDKGEFRGRQALEAEAQAGVERHLHGLVLEGRRPPRSGQTVLLDGEPIGQITSGNFSPMLEKGIALALLDQELENGKPVTIDVRGSEVGATIHAPPFTS